MFVILNWSAWKNITVITTEDGTPKVFGSGVEAVEYATRNLNFNWQIINLEG
jgi:hypothetical protein